MRIGRSLACFGGERHPGAEARDSNHLIDGEVPAAQHHGLIREGGRDRAIRRRCRRAYIGRRRCIRRCHVARTETEQPGAEQAEAEETEVDPQTVQRPRYFKAI